MATEKRQSEGRDKASRTQRWAYLANERAMWGQRREALERKKEAEEMAQCTFTPHINSVKRSEGGSRKFTKFHFMSPIRVTNNVLSSEERELLQHCTFSPNRNMSKKQRPKSAGRVDRRPDMSMSQTAAVSHSELDLDMTQVAEV